MKGFHGYEKDLKKINEMKEKNDQLDYLESNLQAVTAYYTLDRALEAVQKLQDENIRLLDERKANREQIRALKIELKKMKMEGLIAGTAGS